MKLKKYFHFKISYGSKVDTAGDTEFIIESFHDENFFDKIQSAEVGQPAYVKVTLLNDDANELTYALSSCHFNKPSHSGQFTLFETTTGRACKYTCNMPWCDYFFKGLQKDEKSTSFSHLIFSSADEPMTHFSLICNIEVCTKEDSARCDKINEKCVE